MFEKRSEKQLIVIYVIIAITIAFIMGIVHYFQGWDYYVIIIVANIWFFVCSIYCTYH